MGIPFDDIFRSVQVYIMPNSIPFLQSFCTLTGG
nr:MAG TPA: hypothetical protein [Caudoviricetes sp.]